MINCLLKICLLSQASLRYQLITSIAKSAKSAHRVRQSYNGGAKNIPRYLRLFYAFYLSDLRYT